MRTYVVGVSAGLSSFFLLIYNLRKTLGCPSVVVVIDLVPGSHYAGSCARPILAEQSSMDVTYEIKFSLMPVWDRVTARTV